MTAISQPHALKEAIRHHKAGRLDKAEPLYRAQLAAMPDCVEAHHNLGVVLAQRGKAMESLDYFKRALDLDADTPLYWLSYARALLAAGRREAAGAILRQAEQRGIWGPAFDSLASQAGIGMVGEAGSPFAAAAREFRSGRLAEAVALYRRGLQAAPDNSEQWFNLGFALASTGGVEEAIAAYRQAVALRPDFAEAHYHLGSLLSENGRIAEGFEHLMRRAALTYGAGNTPAKDKPDPPHKIKHDLEQRDYLAGGVAGPDAPAVDDLFHLGDGGRVGGPAVNPANATPELLTIWRGSWPQMVVIENFLMPAALEKLRAYCAESTIWRRIYDAGYIGATPPDGFACPLLAQIAEEIAATWPQIFAPHHFAYLGAFKYDSELSTGTNTHADFAAINVNFYITADEANRNPESGGMKIWDVSTEDEAEMRRFNSNEAAIRDHLERSGAKATIVPHRANRAVIFRSSLFHKTDDCDFREGYLNKRINVSLLFGKLGAAKR